MDPTNQSKEIMVGETLYLISSADAERMEEMLNLVRNTFWELLIARKVDFPNSYMAQKASKKIPRCQNKSDF